MKRVSGIVNVNIAQEYSKHVCTSWQKLSELTRDIFKPHPKHEISHHRDMFQTVSMSSIQFLQEKLKSLETHQG